MVNIELKGQNTAKPVKNTIEAYLARGWEPGDFLVSSFNHEELRKFQRLIPTVPVGVIFFGIPLGYAEYAQRINACSINLAAEFANAEMVNDAHGRGIKVFFAGR